MFGLSLLRRLPPKLSADIFYYVLPVVLLLRFLVGTILGVFFLSAILYWAMWTMEEPKPFTLSQLVLWIDGIPSESKTAIVTSVLTVFGFLIAFHTATVNWKAEAVALLKAKVADEIEAFFTEASRLITDAEIYAKSLVEAVNFFHSQGATTEAIFKIQRTAEKTSAFLTTRDRLSAMSVEVHSIAGRHYSVLSTVWGATKALEDCAAVFAQITQLMWIRVPNVHADLPNPIAQFLSQVNVAECVSFVDYCRGNRGFISGATGGVRGALLAPLVGFNLASLISFSGKRSMFIEALSKVRNGN